MEHHLSDLRMSMENRKYTNVFRMRKFVSPLTDEEGCCAAWHHRLQQPTPPPARTSGFTPLDPQAMERWGKTWKIKSWYATPRDQITLLKLQHRTLYVAQREAPPMDKCRACGSCAENQQHLCECDVMFNEYWADLLQLAVATGMPTPQDVPTFLLTGWLGKDAKGNERVISNDHAGIFFIGWRCLYAEIVRSRVDAIRIDLEKALRRAVAMIIGRIKAALSFWKSRVQTTRYQRRSFEISEKRRDRKIAYQEADGEYRLHQDLLSLATDLGLDPTKG